MTYAAQVLGRPSLRAYYRLGDASGTTMTDSSGNARHGSYVGAGLTLGVPGLLTGDADTAINVNGTEARGEVADAAWMDAGSTLSVIAWIKTSYTGGYQYIVDRDTNGRLWQIRLRPNGNLEFEKIAGTFVSSLAATTLNDGARHQVAFTYDGANIRLYADGALVQTTAASGSLDGAAMLAIGATWAGTGGFGPHRFIGDIDEVSYYGATLSGTDIADDFDAGTTNPAITLTLDAVLPAIVPAFTVQYHGITLTLDAVLPAIVPAFTLDYAGPITTDTSNDEDGLDLSMTGLVTITRPVAAPPAGLALAPSYDKAIAYPDPVMVDGRPT